jgi:hypothetical protein
VWQGGQINNTAVVNLEKFMFSIFQLKITNFANKKKEKQVCM